MKPPLIDGSLLIDNSSLERFTTCPRSAEYYIVRKRESADPKTALEFGKAIHEALAVRYADPEPNYVDSAMESRQIERLAKSFEGIEIPEGEFRTYDRAVQMLQEYNKRYPMEPFKVLKTKDGKPAVELSFAVPLGMADNIPIVWTGRIDLIVEWDGQVWIGDHKTTSMLGANYFSEFYNSAQMSGYIWAASKLLGIPVRGVFINALANRRPTKTGTPIEFARDRIYYLPENVEEWATNTLTICSDFIHNCDRDYFPQHMKWCVNKYGKCPYFDVCTLPPEQRATMLGSNLFKDVTWSPLND